VDSAREATIVGSTSSVNFPTTPGAVQTTYAGGNLDAFVSKLDSTGSRAVYSTYLGGSGEDRGLGIALDVAGNAFVTGSTGSADFPAVHALQPAPAGGTCGSASATPCTDAFVTELNAAGTMVVYSTYLGGTGGDSGNAIAVDASGAAYVAGMTASSDFPVTPGTFQQTGGGVSVDAFVAKIYPAGAATAYSTYLGGIGQETAYGIAVDSSGDAYVTGYVYDDAFPVASPVQEKNGGFYDAFLTELNAAGSALIFSSYLGGSGNDMGQGIALDAAGNTYLAGGTFSVDFPTESPFQPGYGGGSFDAFVAKITGLEPPELALSGACCTFSPQGVATTSLPKTVTLTNLGGMPAQLSFGLTGDFTQTNNCGTNLGPGGSCAITVKFVPTAMGNRTGTLTVTDEGPGNSLTIQLSGTAVAAFSLSSAPPDATVVMGTDSASFTVTAASSFSYQGKVSLACEGSEPIQCAFNPAVIVPGTQSSLTVANLSHSTFSLVAFDVEGAGQNQMATLPLTIVISDFKITTTSSAVTVSAGQAATFQLTLEPVNGFDQPVAMACEGAPAQATCSVSPLSVAPISQGGTSMNVTVTTTAGGFAEPRMHGPATLKPAPGFGWLWLTLVATLCLSAARKREQKLMPLRLVAATLGFCLFLCASCGGGGVGGPGIVAQKGSTPAGRYTLKVSGTSGQLIRSVTLTLVVN
jgi:Beta-propeller repeat/HYDIN/CFA65/VesB-like, Ig-like domain